MQCKRCKKEIPEESLFCLYCGRKQAVSERKKRRFPNGYGGIVYLGAGRNKPWGIRVTDGKMDGKQAYRYISYHASEKEAVAALANEQVNPTPTSAGITFKQVYDEWVLTSAYTSLSHQTQANYNAAIKHLSAIYDILMRDVRTGHMQRAVDNAMTVVKKGKLPQPLGKSSKQKIKLLCGLLFKYAMQNDIVHKNYAEFIRVDEKEEKKPKEIFTDIDIKKLEKATDMPWADTILILIYTGLRINELLSLTRFAVDFDAMTITGGLKTDAGKDRKFRYTPKSCRTSKNGMIKGQNF